MTQTTHSHNTPPIAGAATDDRALRLALGRFATGVAVVTTLDDQGTAIGLTINSFASLSLSPPLVLWSLALKSRNLQVFEKSRGFAISILAADQEPLAERFTRQHIDRFAGVALQSSPHQMPVLADCAAWFVCDKSQQQTQGDHALFIGHVVQYGVGYDQHAVARPPLMYLSGQCIR